MGWLSSAMPSMCMYRCWSCHSSFCSISTAPTRRMMLSSFGKIPTTSARRLTSLLSRSSGLVGCNFVRCWVGEAGVGEHVGFGLVHAGAELGPTGAQLVGDLSPDLRCAFLIGLKEDLADRGGDDSVLALGHIGQGIAHEVHPAALPGGAHDAGDRALEALVSIGDDQLRAGPRC